MSSSLPILPTTVIGSYSMPEWLERAKNDYLSRRVTFDAELLGWPYGLSNRPHGGGDVTTFGPVSGAYAAPGPGLRLRISNLETLTAASAEQPNLMLEPGNYRGTVTITLAVAN